jgi:hypothetical protein
VINNRQFFDHQIYDSPEARQPRPRQRPDFSGVAVDYVRTGRIAPDVPPVVGRKARQAVNQARIATDAEYATRANAKISIAPESVGMPQHEGFWDKPWLPATHGGEHEWRKFGHVEEVPTTATRAGQPDVAGERVAELHKQPGRGTDPRFSGSMRELPHAVRTSDDEYVYHQGHHRIVADKTKTQPEMFHTTRVVNEPQTIGQASEMSGDLNNYRVERAARMGVAKRQVMYRENPFA